MKVALIPLLCMLLAFLPQNSKADLLYNKVNAKQTYRNPIINADVPDMALCHANGYYYMVSTTMHLMPGGPIMRSKDMIHWKTVSYLFDRIEDGPRYDLIDNATVYGQGQWASSIRFHNGKFYVWFTANGAPGKGFVFCADKAEGPWKLIARPPHHHDASLFFDEDGRVYLFHGSGSCTVTELKEDLSDVKEGGLNQRIINADADERGGLLEGSQVFKHKGKYYVCMISMNWGIPGRIRREVCYRSDKITGPYEKHIILETPFEEYGGVGQGCVVNGNEDDDNDESNWWAMIFQDRDAIGRVPCTMPCTWVNGWPMLGELKSEGLDPSLPSSYHIPNDMSKDFEDWSGIVGSDDFTTQKLDIRWEWNHNPVNTAWSLTERKGWMRLKTSRICDNIYTAPNTLSQRMTAPECTGEICIDITKMKDGDNAGFSAFNGDGGNLTVVKENGKHSLVLTEEHLKMVAPRNVEGVDRKTLETIDIPKGKKRVWLRIHGNFLHRADMCSFSYSFDGKQWTKMQTDIKVRYDYRRLFMGTRFAIFNYATKETGGYIDVDYFKYDNR